MNINIEHPVKKYPYLAIWTGGEPVKVFDNADVVIVSLVKSDCSGGKEAYVQYLNGSRVGYFTKKEEEYCALPLGTKIELIQ